MAVKLLTFVELKDHGVRLSRRRVDRLQAKGRFPKRVPIGDARVGWVEAEIDALREGEDRRAVAGGRNIGRRQP